MTSRTAAHKSILALVFTLLSAISVTHSFQLPSGKNALELDPSSPALYSNPMLYPLMVHEKQVYILDNSGRKLLSCDLFGRNKSKIQLPDELWQKNLPFTSFAILKQPQKFAFVSASNQSIVFYDTKSRHSFSAGSKQLPLLQYPAEIYFGNNLLVVSDLITRECALFSPAMNLLTTMPFQGDHVLPYSETEVLVVDNQATKTVLQVVNLFRKTRTLAIFAPQPSPELFQLIPIGVDSDGWFYFEKLNGKSHGVPEISVIKVSPLGTIDAEKIASVSSEDYTALSRHFTLVDSNWLLQLSARTDGLRFQNFKLP
jgi:hypothetical protein